MSLRPTHRTNCSACGQRYQGRGLELLSHHYSQLHGYWLWHQRFLCPPCYSAYGDWIRTPVEAAPVKSTRRRIPV